MIQVSDRDSLLAYSRRIASKAEQACRWLTVEGLVERSSVRSENSFRRGSTHRAEIEYRYTVRSRSYTSDRILVGLQPNSRSSAEGYCERYPVGSAVEVCFNPEDPVEAYLEPRQGMAWVLRWVGVGQLVFGIVVLLQ